MKTFNQFQQDLQEAIPLAAPFILPAAAAALGAAGMIYQARKRQPPQPSPDYGQSGETAKPRTPNVQRGRLDPNEVYRRRRAELNRQDAQARAQEKVERKIDELIGSPEERRRAADARLQNQILSRQKSTRDRMKQAGQNIPPEHRAD